MAEPIAIVGMACRLPGHVNSPSDLWKLLRERRSAQGPVPADRWNKDAFYHPNAEHPGTINHQGGYFIQDDIRAFDESFFGINRLDAETMDPQQRNLLEVVYESLESGGIRLEDVSGANVGCYVANFTSDNLFMRSKDPESITRQMVTGTGLTILSNRISHVLNLAGPSVVLDTACSSSVYALHFACLSLQAGETNAAVVAGTNLIFTPEQQIFTSKVGVLSPTSACHWADVSADGYGRADGVTALYVKRLSDAIRDGDPIRSVIRASALNCNGRTFGITLPSAEGQEAVIRQAYRKAGVSTDETGYVECHGTGTAVGDPIEIEALSRVFSPNRSSPLILGSVKTNVGHSEAACGITSIIKSTLILENGIIPPSYGVTNINPKIKLREWNVHVATENTRWPGANDGKPRRISMNCFGYGGANAHVVLEDAAGAQRQSQSNGINGINGTHQETELNGFHSPDYEPTLILPFSASEQSSLEVMIANMTSHDASDYDVRDLAFTLTSRRSLLKSRAFCLARQTNLENSSWLESIQIADSPATTTPARMAFVFTGQGAQWSGMASDLLTTSYVFRASILEQDACLAKAYARPNWTIEDTLLDTTDKNKINDSSRSQPVGTAVQIALVDLLAAWGVEPDIVVGHSSGEIAAAYAANHITREEAILLAYYRGTSLASNNFKGAMLAVSMNEEDSRALIEDKGLSDLVQVACMNSPESTTLSGAESAIDILLQELQARGEFARKLRTGGRAYHSSSMAESGREYQKLISDVLQSKNGEHIADTVEMISTVSGKPVRRKNTRDPVYWRMNLESPVRFLQAVALLLEQEQVSFLEVGPSSTLELPLKQICLAQSDADVSYSSMLRRNSSSVESSLKAIGRLFLTGHPVDLHRVNRIQLHGVDSTPFLRPRVITDLPKYPWKRDGILWNEPRRSTEYRFRKYCDHTLLGTLVPGGRSDKPTWRKILRTRDVPWLQGHQIEGTIVFPAAGYIVMAMEALRQHLHLERDQSSELGLENVKFLKALKVQAEPAHSVEILTELCPMKLCDGQYSDAQFEFEVLSVVEGLSELNACGRIFLKKPGDKHNITGLPVCAPEALVEGTTAKQIYDHLRSQGLGYGIDFRPISSVNRLSCANADTCSFDLTIPPAQQEVELSSDEACRLSVVAIDSLFQGGIIADSAANILKLRGALPVSIGSMTVKSSTVNAMPEGLRIYAKAEKKGFGTIHFAARLCSPNADQLVSVSEVEMSQYVAADSDGGSSDQKTAYSLEWKPDIERITPRMSLELSSYLENESRTVDEYKSLDIPLHSTLILDLIMHKHPNCRIVEFDGEGNSWGSSIHHLGHFGSKSQRFGSLLAAKLEENGSVKVKDVDLTPDSTPRNWRTLDKSEGSINVVIIHEASTLESWTKIYSDSPFDWLAEDHWLICAAPNTSSSTKRARYEVMWGEGDGSDCAIMRSAQNTAGTNQPASNDVFVVIPHESSPGISQIQDGLARLRGSKIRIIFVSDVSTKSLPEGALVVCALELDKPFLKTVTPSEYEALQIILKQSSSLLWLTCGNLSHCERPDLALASSMFRTLKQEYYPIKIALLDIDNMNERTDRLSESIAQIVRDLSSQTESISDDEYRLVNGLVHISRFRPRRAWDDEWEGSRRRNVTTVERKELGPSQLALSTPGMLSSIHMESTEEPRSRDVGPEEVEVEVDHIGLNAKDLYAVDGRVQTRDSTCCLEYAGTIIRAGHQVGHLAVGDVVLVMAPGKFSTREIAPAWACCRLRPGENAQEMATIPLVFSSALYGLKHRANLQRHESMLIHSAAGGLGQAAIQVAKNIGAEIFATVGNDEKKEHIHKTYNIPMNRIFSSRDTSFRDRIMDATEGRGVDVVLNSLTGDLLHASWQCCAPFGRFIEVGKADIQASRRLDMSVFSRGATFSAFDLTDLYYSDDEQQRRMWTSLLMESVSGIRAGSLKVITPLTTFDISEVTEAFQSLASRARIGKVVISLDNPKSLVKYRKPVYSTRLDPNKSYLLVGCLGGIGRLICRWVFSRGARHMIFIGRSGATKEPARALIKEFEDAGVAVDIITGDAADKSTVKRALAAVKTSLGGVIHAPTDVSEGKFSDLEHSKWQQMLGPKVRGTWTLHNCLAEYENELDFFLLTSSMAGSVGQYGESSYCAANGFLDAFARFRRQQGLTATALGIGAIEGVGWFAYHPEQYEVLLKIGYEPLSQVDLLQLLDLAVANAGKGADSDSSLDRAHFVTGISGQTNERHVRHLMRDPRASQLRAQMERSNGQQRGGGSSEGDSKIPAAVRSALESKDKKALQTAVAQAVGERLAKLVHIPAEKVNAQTLLNDLGMDSMLAMEARQSATLGVQISVIELITGNSTVGSMASLIVERLLEGV